MNLQKPDTTIQGYRDVLRDHVTHDTPADKSYAQSREGSPSTVRFAKSGDECSFPYALLQYVRFKGGNIIVRSNTAKITIEGKNLRPLYLQIERYKTDSVTLTPPTTPDNGQPIIDAISIIFDED